MVSARVLPIELCSANECILREQTLVAFPVRARLLPPTQRLDPLDGSTVAARCLRTVGPSTMRALANENAVFKVDGG